MNRVASALRAQAHGRKNLSAPSDTSDTREPLEGDRAHCVMVAEQIQSAMMPPDAMAAGRVQKPTRGMRPH